MQYIGLSLHNILFRMSFMYYSIELKSNNYILINFNILGCIMQEILIAALKDKKIFYNDNLFKK